MCMEYKTIEVIYWKRRLNILKKWVSCAKIVYVKLDYDCNLLGTCIANSLYVSAEFAIHLSFVVLWSAFSSDLIYSVTCLIAKMEHWRAVGNVFPLWEFLFASQFLSFSKHGIYSQILRKEIRLNHSLGLYSQYQPRLFFLHKESQMCTILKDTFQGWSWLSNVNVYSGSICPSTPGGRSKIKVLLFLFFLSVD